MNSKWEWVSVVVLLLLAWGLRLCCMETVPPGWRDDELINIHALSGELLAGRFPLYYTGASGHEPLYHHLHAGVQAALGSNVLSGHLLSIAFGMLAVALTYALTCRLFGRWTAIVASLALTASFWSLMYSRIAIRHISLPPLALATFYLFWRAIFKKPGFSVSEATKTWFLVGLTMGLSLYTYPAARLLPVLLVLFFVYLALFHRDRFSRHWRGLLLALIVAAVLVAPMGVAIAQGRSEAAAEGIGADARIAELAVPLQELQAGNPRPLLENVWGTLGMFHATGDPEWLYNIPHRPVFNLFGGFLLWAGVALCLYRWRRPRYLFLLLWLGLGLLPAFVSTPLASLSHTILAQPVAYILPALALTAAYRWLKSREWQVASGKWSSVIGHCSLVIGHWSLLILFLTGNAARDLRDYFTVWPQQDMTRFLYRADYREAARYLDAHPEITDVAISSTLMGPWDRLALEVDIRRDDIAARLFDSSRALVWVTENAPSPVLLTAFPIPAAPITSFLDTDADPPEAIASHLKLYTLSPTPNPSAPAEQEAQSPIPNFQFANGLELTETRWLGNDILLTSWRVAAPLDLPHIPIVANPPPPGVYTGPRLAVFVHLLDAGGTLVASDDGLWVDPLTLRPGDRFVQVHRLTGGPYTLELGLYDPMTGERWFVLDTKGQPLADRLLLDSAQNP